MAKKNSYSVEDNIRFHETHLAELINERDAAIKEKGESISDYYLDRTDRIIANIEHTIHNYRTKGRAYD